tara:strand:- start:4674 stop:5402 length:729 start_codon:yes stop_codon:yes gene_type:complete
MSAGSTIGWGTLGSGVGATIGGLAGSFIAPGAGTALGAKIGAGLGGAAGSYLGSKAGGGSGRQQSTLAGTQQQQQELEGELESGRMSVLQGYDQAAASKQALQKMITDNMRSAIGVPASAMLATLGSAGLTASGAASAQAREGGVLAQKQAAEYASQINDALAQLKLARETQALGFAEQDVEAAAAAADKAATDAEMMRNQYTFSSDYVQALRSKRDLYAPGTPEYEAYNNAANVAAQKYLT